MPHPPVWLLERYYMQRLSPADVAAVEKHLEDCAECAQYLRETDLMTRVLRAAAQQDDDA